MRINRNQYTGKSLKLNFMSSNCLINRSRAYVWFSVPYRSFVICAGGGKTNKNKTNVRHAHVIFYVFNQLQATGGRCSHICKCKVAPHHPFVQTCIHAYADGHSLLSRWLSCPPTHPRANYSSTIRKGHVDIRQFHLQLSEI